MTRRQSRVAQSLSRLLVECDLSAAIKLNRPLPQSSTQNFPSNRFDERLLNETQLPFNDSFEGTSSELDCHRRATTRPFLIDDESVHLQSLHRCCQPTTFTICMHTRDLNSQTRKCCNRASLFLISRTLYKLDKSISVLRIFEPKVFAFKTSAEQIRLESDRCARDCELRVNLVYLCRRVLEPKR